MLLNCHKYTEITFLLAKVGSADHYRFYIGSVISSCVGGGRCCSESSLKALWFHVEQEGHGEKQMGHTGPYMSALQSCMGFTAPGNLPRTPSGQLCFGGGLS